MSDPVDVSLLSLGEMFYAEASEYDKRCDELMAKYQNKISEADSSGSSRIEMMEADASDRRESLEDERQRFLSELSAEIQDMEEQISRACLKQSFKKQMDNTEKMDAISIDENNYREYLNELRSLIDEITYATGLKRLSLGKTVHRATSIAGSLRDFMTSYEQRSVEEFDRRKNELTNESMNTRKMVISNNAMEREGLVNDFEREMENLDRKTEQYLSDITFTPEYRALESVNSSLDVPIFGDIYIISNLPNMNEITIPVVADGYGTLSYCIIEHSTDQLAIQNMVSHIMAKCSVNDTEFVFADLCYSGGAFSPFVRYLSPSKNVSKVITALKDLNEALIGIQVRIDEIVQYKLSPIDGIRDIKDFNNLHDEKIKPLFLFLIARSSDLSESMVFELRKLITNGYRCGFHIILSLADDDRDSGNKALTELINKDMASIFTIQQDYALRYNGLTYLFDFRPVSINSVLEKNQNAITQELSREPDRSLSIPPVEEWFKTASEDGLIIPVGVSEGKEVDVILGKETSHHVLIAGNTGSGKTSLLHTIITSACVRYSPADLQIILLDFKEGVEFIRYSESKLPHIKLITLSCVQEFALNVFNQILEEIEERGRLFKSVGATDLTSYRKKGHVMPRILMIADEFQFIFDPSDNPHMAEDCASAYDRIVRIGRSFGIHTIMATQNISSLSSSSLQKSTLSQLVERIVLGLPFQDSDAQYMLGDNYKDVRLIDRPRGTGVINYSAGFYPSVKADFIWIPEDESISILNKIHNNLIEKGFDYNAKVFDLNSIPNIADLEPFMDSLRGGFVLGKSMKLKPEHIAIPFNGRSTDETLSLLTEKELKRGLKTALKTFLADQNNTSIIINVSLGNVSYDNLLSVDAQDAIPQLKSLYENYLNRKGSPERFPPIMIILGGLSDLDGLNIMESKYDWNEDTKNLYDMILNGPKIGMRFLVNCEMPSSFKKVCKSFSDMTLNYVIGSQIRPEVFDSIGVTPFQLLPDQIALIDSNGDVSKIILYGSD